MVHRGSGGYPEVALGAKECTFCSRCALACEAGALDAARQVRPWTIVARVGSRCLALRGVVCNICGEHCEWDALSFLMDERGVGVPTIAAEACTGCGACAVACPNDAIGFVDQARQQSPVDAGLTEGGT